MLSFMKMIVILIASFFAGYGIVEFWVYVLGKFQININKKQKWWIIWAVSESLVSLIGLFYLVHLLLFR